jgi:hypothetical protein
MLFLEVLVSQVTTKNRSTFPYDEQAKMSAEELLKTAIVYDFDGTLARGNIQECSFIPKMNMSRKAFWDEVKERKEREDAEKSSCTCI